MKMLFYTLMIPVLIMSLLMIFYLMKLKKHDKVLFRFCKLRREIMDILKRDNFNLTQTDYISLRNLLNGLNINIHYYNELKSSVFNIRRFFKSLREYQDSTEKIGKIKLPENEQLIVLYNNFAYTMLTSFLAYTPFIRSELILNLIIYVLKKLAKKLGRESIITYIEILNRIRKQTEDFGIQLNLIHYKI